MARSLPLSACRNRERQSSDEHRHFIFAGFFLIGTDLLGRAAVQGVEQALVTTAIEYGSAVVTHVSKWARASTQVCFAERVE